MDSMEACAPKAFVDLLRECADICGSTSTRDKDYFCSDL